MYTLLLTLHSLLRWLVLAALLWAIARGLRGWRGKRPFTRIDDRARRMGSGLAQLQMLVGLALYGFSPITRYFLGHFRSAVHERSIRFFGMEHITMMLIAVVLISIGSGRARKALDDREKFRTMTRWFLAALLVIFISIPWSFSPVVSRPLWRFF